jgi:hypothetical protein
VLTFECPQPKHWLKQTASDDGSPRHDGFKNGYDAGHGTEDSFSHRGFYSSPRVTLRDHSYSRESSYYNKGNDIQDARKSRQTPEVSPDIDRYCICVCVRLSFCVCP